MSRRGIIGCFVLICMELGKSASAAQWDLKGALLQQAQYNDNIALSPVNQSVVGYLLTPSLHADYKAGSLDIGFNGGGEIRRYDDQRWDCDNYTLGMTNRYQVRRSGFSLSGGYRVSCAYAQQIQDTGILAPASQIESYNLAPSWTWQWTPRDQILARASYAKTSFSNSRGGSPSTIGAGTLGFRGNDTYSVNFEETHAWNRLLSSNAGIYFTNVQYTGANALTQNIVGFQLGVNYLLGRSWTISASEGPRWADSRQQSVGGALSSNNNSWVLGNSANIGVTYKDRLYQFSAGYSNAINPSAIGQTLQVHSVFANYSYQFSHAISLNINGSFLHSQPIVGKSTGNPTTQFNRDYFTASAGLIWELARNWQLKGSYIYRWQQFKQQATATDSNAVMLSLNYAWDGIQDSR